MNIAGSLSLSKSGKALATAWLGLSRSLVPCQSFSLSNHSPFSSLAAIPAGSKSAIALTNPSKDRPFTRQLSTTMSSTTNIETPSEPVSTTESSSTPPPTLIIYALFGSQYVFKVLAAIQSNKNIQHYVHGVPLTASQRRKVLPSGGYLVPEMLVLLNNDDKTKIVVPGSEDILKWINANYKYPGDSGKMESPNWYPNEQAGKVSERVSDGVLGALVLYYNWVHPVGHKRSMRQTIGTKVFPSYAPWMLVDLALWSTRNHQKENVLTRLPDAPIDDENAMMKLLQTELEYLESLLETDDQPYLIAGTTEPSAADFSAYAMMERLVGSADENPSSDSAIYPSVPEVKTENPFGLKRLWKWHDHMRTTYKVQFRGHRVPKDILADIPH